MLRYPIVNEGKQVGRLQVDIQAAVREKDNIPMYVMTLTARGMVGKGVDFFDLGRQAVVNSFAQLTTPEMRKIWRRTQ